jgi:RNA polymerase sigma factor (sigma-70 family)
VNEAEIWLSCKDDLVRYAAVLIGPADAEDVVSTVVVRVLSRRTLADLEDARRYLFRAVLNECRTRAVRRREALTLTDLAEPPPPDPQPEVLDAVLSLPVAQRAATFLVYWADLSIAETARLMGARPGTVKRYLHLARAKLKGALHEHERIHTDR